MLVFTLAAYSGKRNVTVWRPSIRRSVCLSITSAYSPWLTRGSKWRGQCTFRPDNEDRNTCLHEHFARTQKFFVSQMQHRNAVKKAQTLQTGTNVINAFPKDKARQWKSNRHCWSRQSTENKRENIHINKRTYEGMNANGRVYLLSDDMFVDRTKITQHTHASDHAGKLSTVARLSPSSSSSSSSLLYAQGRD